MLDTKDLKCANCGNKCVFVYVNLEKDIYHGYCVKHKYISNMWTHRYRKPCGKAFKVRLIKSDGP